MIGGSKNSTENYPRKSFWRPEKETRVIFTPGLSTNRPSNNLAQVFIVAGFKCISLYDELQPEKITVNFFLKQTVKNTNFFRLTANIALRADFD